MLVKCISLWVDEFLFPSVPIRWKINVCLVPQLCSWHWLLKCESISGRHPMLRHIRYFFGKTYKTQYRQSMANRVCRLHFLIWKQTKKFNLSSKQQLLVCSRKFSTVTCKLSTLETSAPQDVLH